MILKTGSKSPAIYTLMCRLCIGSFSLAWLAKTVFMQMLMEMETAETGRQIICLN